MSTEVEKKTNSSGDDFQYEPVPKSQRKTWFDLTFVWFGAAMVAQLYQAGVSVTIGTGGLPTGLQAILIGALFLAFFTALNGFIGYKTHCNAALSSRYAYGSVGVAIPGFHIADIGWYVVNAAMFCSILVSLFPAIDVKVWCILFSMLFITNNYVGFSKMVILNRFAFPVLLITGLYGIYRCGQMPGGFAGLWSATFPQTMTVNAGVAMVIGTWAAGCSRAADYMRFAKDAKSSFIASFLGYLIPPIAAVSIADYFILSKTKYHWTGHKNYYEMDVNSEDVTHHKFNWATIPALVAGLLLGWKLNWGISSVNAFVGTVAVYTVASLILYAAGMQKKEVALNEALAARK